MSLTFTYMRCRAIDNGANFLAEGFLFSVAAGLIIAEAWRSSRSESKRREGVSDKFEEMQERINGLESRAHEWEQRMEESAQRCVVALLQPSTDRVG